MIEFTADQIAAATKFPVPRIAECWRHLAPALVEGGLTERNTVVAALATTAVECGFQCIGELPIDGGANFAAYEGRRENPVQGDGERYKGRGYIQLTSRANYQRYGRLIGVDLENDPERACEPAIAAKVLVAYFIDRGVPYMARQAKWEGVRRAVNGGTIGLAPFVRHVNALLAVSVPITAGRTVVTPVPAPPPTSPPTPAPVPAAADPLSMMKVEGGWNSEICQRSMLPAYLPNWR